MVHQNNLQVCVFEIELIFAYQIYYINIVKF